MSKKAKSTENPKGKLGFLTKILGKSFFLQLLLIGVFLAICILLGFGWLKIYTNHGQKLVLPDYEKKTLIESEKDAKTKSFKIIVTDSIHDLDYPGGIILSQNPPPNSLVKEKRKIYVTTTKFSPDLILLDDLPGLYGNPYTSMRTLIEGFGLRTKIQDYRFDSGPENTILEVIYKGDVIINREGKKPNFNLEKGGTLNFILAKSSGGVTKAPDLVCSEYATAEFLADSYRLILQVVDDEEITLDQYDGTFVTRQIPSQGSELLMNDTIKIYLSRSKPSDCGKGLEPEDQF